MWQYPGGSSGSSGILHSPEFFSRKHASTTVCRSDCFRVCLLDGIGFIAFCICPHFLFRSSCLCCRVGPQLVIAHLSAQLFIAGESRIATPTFSVIRLS